MIRLLSPFILLLLGIGGGVGAGLALRPAAAPEPAMIAATPAECPPGADAAHDITPPSENAPEGGGEHEYIKLNNQFVVPVVSRDMVAALVVMSLSVEIEPGQAESVYRHEPKLRDSFLQVLFDHSNMGGFKGEFTDANNMDVLRGALTEVARATLGNLVKGVLITDIARQDT